MIKSIAIDDEPIALQQMASYIEKAPFLELCGQFDNAIEALDFLKDNQVDLMFVDINMPDISGVDFVKMLTNPPHIIFTTAYSEYALEGFKLDAVDYLLKPISFAAFIKSANKVNERFNISNKQSASEGAPGNDFLMLKSEHKIVRVNLSDIKYIESMREYVRIHIDGQKSVMSLMSMKKLEEKLTDERFMRVHRSYIVNVDKITVIERSRIVFDKDVYIPVSDQYKEKFQSFLDSKFLG